MQYNDFLSEVQNQTDLESKGKAITAIHATLETLGERLNEDSAESVGGLLPEELDSFVLDGESDQNFPLEEFYNRVSLKTNVDRESATRYAKIIMKLLEKSISQNMDLRKRLPPEYSELLQ